MSVNPDCLHSLYSEFPSLTTDTETRLPFSLMEMMSADGSLGTLQAFRANTDVKRLGGALRIQVPYDNQRAKFVNHLLLK